MTELGTDHDRHDDEVNDREYLDFSEAEGKPIVPTFLGAEACIYKKQDGVYVGNHVRRSLDRVTKRKLRGCAECVVV
jgi:hypothetical protein